MHEASLINDLMSRIQQIAEAEDAKRIVGVSVWLGALSHMSESHFHENFQQAARGTIAESAKLDITLSTDDEHPDAQSIRLESVDIEN